MDYYDFINEDEIDETQYIYKLNEEKAIKKLANSFFLKPIEKLSNELYSKPSK